MTRSNPIPQPATESGAALAESRPESPGRATWDFESLSWLAPGVPLRQVICILGAGQETVREQFRLLHTRLEDLRRTRPLKSILVTSSLPEEGKSFVALNLAVALSQGGRNRVLLLEADMRRPSCCAALGIRPVPGLAECCGSDGPVSGFVYRVAGLDLCLMPASAGPVLAAELLPARRLAQVLAETGRNFDWLVVDSSPLLPVADTVALSRRCDGILLVVRRNRTPKAALREALDRIEPAKLLGLVLNHFPSPHNCYAYFRSFSASAPRTEPVETYREAA